MKLEDLTPSVYYKLAIDNGSIELDILKERDNSTTWIVLDYIMITPRTVVPHISIYVTKDGYYVLAQMDINNANSSIMSFGKYFFDHKGKPADMCDIDELRDSIADYIKNMDFERLIMKIVEYCNQILAENVLVKLAI